MDLMKNFENNVKLMLKEKGWTQLRLSQELGVSDSTVSDWFIKHKDPAGTTIYKITKLLNCTINDLFE